MTDGLKVTTILTSTTTTVLAPWPWSCQVNWQTLTSNRLEPAQTWQRRDGLKLTSSDTKNYFTWQMTFSWPRQANQQTLTSNRTYIQTWLKAAKYEIQKPSTCRATLFRCKFWSMFCVFHLAWYTWRNAACWLVDLLGYEQSCEFDEKRVTKPKFVTQSWPALYFSQKLSSTRNKYFCCATSLSCKVKNRKHQQKLAMKQCCTTSWGFLNLIFCRPYSGWIETAGLTIN